MENMLILFDKKLDHAALKKMYCSEQSVRRPILKAIVLDKHCSYEIVCRLSILK